MTRKEQSNSGSGLAQTPTCPILAVWSHLKNRIMGHWPHRLLWELHVIFVNCLSQCPNYILELICKINAQLYFLFLVSMCSFPVFQETFILYLVFKYARFSFWQTTRCMLFLSTYSNPLDGIHKPTIAFFLPASPSLIKNETPLLKGQTLVWKDFYYRVDSFLYTLI